LVEGQVTVTGMEVVQEDPEVEGVAGVEIGDDQESGKDVIVFGEQGIPEEVELELELVLVFLSQL